MLLTGSTAKINPEGQPFCLHHKQTTPITIPIRLNGTFPILIQYSHTSFADPPVIKIHDIIARPLKSMLEHAEVSEESGQEELLFLPFHITEIGSYKLERVVDKSGSDVRLYRSDAIVVECPTAEISSFNKETHFCQGEIDALRIHVKGVPPLHLKYVQNVNGHASTIEIDSIAPESFISPLVHGETSQHVIKHPDYTFAQAHPVTLTYPLSLDTIGLWNYRLSQVGDALGNVVDFENEDELLPLPGYTIAVHETPKVSLRGCSEDNPIKVLKGRDTNLYFNVNTVEAGPFDIVLSYSPPDSTDPATVQSYQLMHKRDSLSVTDPGIYTLLNISSPYCKGDVLAPQSCLVITPSEPSLQIEWSPLKDHCSGTVGVTADLTFIGEPPFHLSYNIISRTTSQHESKRIKVDRSRHQVEFRPEVAGTYQYDFIALDDANYRWIQLEGKMFSYEATVYPLPGVKFVNTDVRKTCIGESLSVPVRMIGSGPWNLTYDIVDGSGKRQSFVERIESTEYTLELPEFKKGGRGTVSLRSITDSSGCKVQLGEEDLVIDVRREKPSAKFYAKTVTGRDGDVMQLPLRLTGEGPWRLTYSWEKNGQQSQREHYITDPNGHIETRSDGVYTLLNVYDSSCPGVIKPGNDKFEVMWIPRPRLEILGFEGEPAHEIKKLDPVCAGEDAFLDLALHGTTHLPNFTNSGMKPFTVEYNIVELDLNGNVVSRTAQEFSAAMNTAQIRLRTEVARKYVYEFTHLSDAVYDDPKNLHRPYVVEQEVRPLPTARFIAATEPHIYCTDTNFDDPKVNGIPVLVAGNLPIDVTLEMRNELDRTVEQIELTGINENQYFFVPPKHVMTHGVHTLTIVEAADNGGCTSQPTENHKTSFTVADEASISPLEPQQHHCVGDRISYSLQGTSPWQIEYEFDGKRNVAQALNPTFSRIAERKGNLTIISIADRASSCRTVFSPGTMEKYIHEIPSVRISGGSNVIENIREGNQSFLHLLMVL